MFLQKIKSPPPPSGFTLVELIVVITILAILGTLGFVGIQGYANKARDAEKESNLALIEKVITITSMKGISVNIGGLTPLTYVSYPKNIVSYVGELQDGLFEELSDAPIDPYSKKPYIIGLYTGGNGGIIKYGQVGSIFSNTEGTSIVDAGVPIQRIRGNYTTNIRGIAGLIPRWALEDISGFKLTNFFTSGEKIFGGTWGQTNSYIFAQDATPLIQLQGYTATGILLYESFENMDTHIITSPGIQANGYKSYPACTGNISISSAYEANTTYTDQIQTVDCKIDKTTGANSKHSFYLKWLRDSSGGDGQFNYMIIDPDRKYTYSLDVKGHLDPSVSGGRLAISFACFKIDSTGTRTGIGSKSFLMPLTTNFAKINAYINGPDPSGNSLSLTLPAGITDSVACIFYRSNAPKAGDELWFDNYIVREVL